MSLRVLIAEGQGLVAAGLKSQLEGLGYDVVGLATDGREAIASALALRPDLILVDIRLPVLDGIEAARAILTRRPVPIVLLTPYASADLVRRGREAGVMAYLLKPVEARQLRSTLGLALARFEELQAVRREANNLKEGFKARKLVEQAKGILRQRLKLSEAEAFRRIQHESRSTRLSLRETASTIVETERLLYGKAKLLRRFQAILAAIRRGLREAHALTTAHRRLG